MAVLREVHHLVDHSSYCTESLLILFETGQKKVYLLTRWSRRGRVQPRSIMKQDSKAERLRYPQKAGIHPSHFVAYVCYHGNLVLGNRDGRVLGNIRGLVLSLLSPCGSSEQVRNVPHLDQEEHMVRDHPAISPRRTA